jgi:putative transposase
MFAVALGSGKKPLDIRFWVCPQCEATHDRDVNAARNILVEGREVLAGLGGDAKRSWRQ